jgi:peptidylprolyl isomerase/peptidyl-prolyl cis-trans isomerase D
MPLMTKMRERMSIIFGIFAVLFIVYIVLDWGMDIGGRKSRGLTKGEIVGKVNGNNITYQSFNVTVEKYIQMFKQQYKTDPDDNQLNQLREEAWNTTVFEILVKQELKKMGLEVTDQEIRDWVYKLPETLPETISRQFVDSTGAFNHQFLQQVIQSQEPQVKDFWMKAEEMLRQTRLESKIASLVLSTVKVPEGDIIQKYNDENSHAEGKFIFFDPNVYADNNMQVSEDDIKNYYDNHKEEYKQEAGRKLRFVVLPIIASKQDTQDVFNEMKNISEDLKKGIDFKSLIEIHSENKYIDTLFMKHGQIGSPELEKKVFDAKIDDVIGPVMDNNSYRLIKIFESKQGKEQYVRVSHILLKYTETNKDSIKKAAINLLNRIKKGENLNELAKKYSEDPTAKDNSGDLGYQGKGTFVKPFEEAAFNAKIGEVVGPVETVYGFHIIKVFGKDLRELKIGDIKITINPSGQTREEIYSNARDFMNLAKDGDFLNEAKVSKLEVHETPIFTKTGVIPGIGYNNSISKFAFNNKAGTVSEVYKLGTAYVVFQVMEERKEGYKNLNELKESIKNSLIFKKKMDVLKNYVIDLRNKINPNDSLEKFTQLDPKLTVISTGSFTPVSSVPGIGRDNKLTARVFNIAPKTISQPLEGSKGYYVFYLYSKSAFNESDYNSKRDGLLKQLLQEKQNMFFPEWRKSLLEKADIEDDRDKFYR